MPPADSVVGDPVRGNGWTVEWVIFSNYKRHAAPCDAGAGNEGVSFMPETTDTEVLRGASDRPTS